MVNLLKVPAIFAGLRFDGHHGVCEEVIAGAHPSIEIGPRVTGGEVEESQFWIDGWSLPNRCPAVLPGVRVFGPSVVPHFARPGNGIESPNQAPVLGVVGFDTATHGLFATREGRNHHTVVIQRGGGNGVPLLPLLGLNRPIGLA